MLHMETKFENNKKPVIEQAFSERFRRRFRFSL